jgi:acetyl-CoA carboxylase carboxyltransferase component
MENDLPCVWLGRSGVFALQDQVLPTDSILSYLYNQVLATSARNIPANCHCCSGSCNGAYEHVDRDLLLSVRLNDQTVLVKAVTGCQRPKNWQVAVHTGISGVADHLAENEPDAFVHCIVFGTTNTTSPSSSSASTTNESWEEPRTVRRTAVSSGGFQTTRGRATGPGTHSRRSRFHEKENYGATP